MKNVDLAEKIYDVVLSFNRAVRYEDLLNTILIKMIEITASDAGTLYILEEGQLHFRIIKNKTLGIFQSADDVIDLPPVVLDEGNIQNVSAYAAIKNEAVVIEDVYTDERFNFTGPKNYDKLTGYRSRSMLVLPMATFRQDKWEVLGVIQLLNCTDETTGEFAAYDKPEDNLAIPALANIAANTLSNLVYIQEIRKVFHSFVSAMVRTVDERSKYNSNHTHKVALLCAAFARYLTTQFPVGHEYNFSEHRLEELTMAAMLHDIGKIVTPIHIMDKADRLGVRLPVVQNKLEVQHFLLENELLRGNISESEYTTGHAQLAASRALIERANTVGYMDDALLAQVEALTRISFINSRGEEIHLLEAEDLTALSIRKGTLTAEERTVMEQHVSTTGRILSSIAFKKYYKNITDWAQSHHEFLDGSGYPRGLKGDELDTEVRIITIMDIFEALTASDRPYKKALPPDKAFDILTDMAEKGKLHAEFVQLFKKSEVWLEVEL